MVSPPSPRDRRKWTKAMMDKEEEQHADRVDAILELKANTDKVRFPYLGRMDTQKQPGVT